MTIRIAFALLACVALSGCLRALKPGYPAKHVEFRVAERASEDVSIRIGKSGSKTFPNAEGIIELELPEIPRRCDTYLVFPKLAWHRYPVPDLYVMNGDRILKKISLISVHDQAETAAMPMELPRE